MQEPLKQKEDLSDIKEPQANLTPEMIFQKAIRLAPRFKAGAVLHEYRSSLLVLRFMKKYPYQEIATYFSELGINVKQPMISNYLRSNPPQKDELLDLQQRMEQETNKPNPQANTVNKLNPADSFVEIAFEQDAGDNRLPSVPGVLELSNGLRLEVGKNCNANDLARILKLLDGVKC